MWIVLLLKILGYFVGVVIAVIAILLWSLRPKKISKDLPGPKRSWLFGITFEESAEFLDGASFSWDK
jgi:hypothetical protein